MKKIVTFFAVFIICKQLCYSQIDSVKIETLTAKQISTANETKTQLSFNKEYYLVKSKTYNKTGNIFSLVGGGLIVSGLLIGSQLNHDYSGVAVAAIGVFFGTASCLISVPFYISSNHNAKLQSHSLKLK